MGYRTSTRFLDLSHPIASGMSVAAGLPRPRIEPYLSHAASRSRYEGRAEFEITRLFFVGNTGTTIDSPYHRYPKASDVAALPLESVVGLEGVCINMERGSAELDDTSHLGATPLSGRAVLIRSGWDRLWGTQDYWTAGPFLNAEFAERLVKERPSIVGVDFANVDDPGDLVRPVHSMLLAAGIPILEHLCGLDRLPRDGFRLFAAPVAVHGASAMPVRVFAEIGRRGLASRSERRVAGRRLVGDRVRADAPSSVPPSKAPAKETQSDVRRVPPESQRKGASRCACQRPAAS